jgi:hypothetical protein
MQEGMFTVIFKQFTVGWKFHLVQIRTNKMIHRIPFFWDTTLRHGVRRSRRFEGKYHLHTHESILVRPTHSWTWGEVATRLRRNVGIRLPRDATTYFRRTESSATPLRNPRNSQGIRLTSYSLSNVGVPGPVHVKPSQHDENMGWKIVTIYIGSKQVPVAARF